MGANSESWNFRSVEGEQRGCHLASTGSYLLSQLVLASPGIWASDDSQMLGRIEAFKPVSGSLWQYSYYCEFWEFLYFLLVNEHICQSAAEFCLRRRNNVF